MVEKLKKLFIFCFLSVSIIACNSGSENGNDGKDNDSTKKAETGYEKPRSMLYDGRKPDISEFNKENFYPIGWSKNGHFAFVKTDTEQGSGFFNFRLEILKMAENEDSWNWNAPEEIEATDTSFSMLWNKNRAVFSKELKKYKIIPELDYKIQPLIFTTKGNNFKISLEKEEKTNLEFNINVVSSAQVIIESPELGVKTFTHKIENDDFWVADIKISGYIKSPHHDDIIGIIYSLERMGFEGPPNDIYFHVIGCDLSAGFSK